MSDPERDLLQHGAAMRAIARDLLRDPHLAADATQDAMHRALSHEGLEPGPMGGWLHRTVVNWARQWKRSERRRLAREANLPQPEPPATPFETSGRREVLRQVTEAVLALDEPYQTAIFLRYFEDLPPRRIAQRTGQNLATIKSRLQRGLVMLRAELTRRSRGDDQRWRLALITSFGLAGTAAAGLTFTTGAWIVATQTKLALAAVVLCASGVLYYGLGQDPTPVPATIDEARDTRSPNAIQGTAPPSTDTAQREAVAADAQLDTWLDHPYEFTLDLLVVDPLGMPVQGHTLRIAPEQCPLDDAATATGADGRVEIRWRGRTPDAEIVVGEERGALCHLRLRSGIAQPWTLLAEPQGEAHRITLAFVGNIANSQPVLLSELPFRTVGGSGETMGPGLHPHAVFSAASPALPAAGPELRISGLNLVNGSFEIAVGSVAKHGIQATPEAAAEAAAAPPARIAGTVFGEDGKPAAEVPVFLLGPTPQPVQRGKTDAQGQFAFESLAPAEFTVRAGGDALGLATARVVTTTGTTTAPVNLRRESCIRGSAHGADHKPVAKAVIEWIAEDGTWRDSTTTAADGTFVLANLPPKAGAVRLWLPGDDRRTPAAALPSVLPDTQDLVLQPTGEAAGVITVRTALPDGLQGAVALRLWSEESGAGTTIPQARRNEPRKIVNLTSGWYRIEAFHAACGWIEAGRHWVDGKNTTDAGTIAMPPPGLARFQFESETLPSVDERAFEVCRVRRDTDVRQAIGDVPLAQDLQLPAGDYVLAWKHRDGSTRFTKFAVKSGNTTVVAPAK